MSDRLKDFEKLAEHMSENHSGVVKSQMFGMPCLKIGGKAFAGFFKEDMVFKLGGEPHSKALKAPGAQLFDPMGGRPMKEWVQVPFTTAKAWQSLSADAMEYVNASAAKSPKKATAKKSSVKKK